MNLISSEGAVKAAFSCNTKDLREVLKFLKAGMDPENGTTENTFESRYP